MPQTPQRYEMYQTADGLIHHPSHHHARFRNWYTGWYTLCEDARMRPARHVPPHLFGLFGRVLES